MTQSIEELLALAKNAHKNKKETEVRDILLKVLKQDVHHSAALFMLGGSYYYSDLFAEAAVIFEQLVLMFPTEGKASSGLYKALWSSGKVTEAVMEIRRFLQAADKKQERELIQTYLDIIETLSADTAQQVNTSLC